MGDADDSLGQFFDLINGTDAIRYWDDAVMDWAPLTSAVNGVDYTLEYLTSGDLSGYTRLTVFGEAGLTGDYNGDHVVDAADYTLWRDNVGGVAAAVFAPGSRQPGIGGAIGTDDYDAWRANFGGTEPTGAGASLTGAAPEPTAWLLLLGTTALAGCGRVSEGSSRGLAIQEDSRHAWPLRRPAAQRRRVLRSFGPIR